MACAKAKISSALPGYEWHGFVCEPVTEVWPQVGASRLGLGHCRAHAGWSVDPPGASGPKFTQKSHKNEENSRMSSKDRKVCYTF